MGPQSVDEDLAFFRAGVAVAGAPERMCEFMTLATKSHVAAFDAAILAGSLGDRTEMVPCEMNDLIADRAFIARTNAARKGAPGVAKAPPNLGQQNLVAGRRELFGTERLIGRRQGAQGVALASELA